MSLKEYLALVIFIILPVVLVAAITTLAIMLVTENQIIRFLLSILAALIISFGVIKWIEFIIDLAWM